MQFLKNTATAVGVLVLFYALAIGCTLAHGYTELDKLAVAIKARMAHIKEHSMLPIASLLVDIRLAELRDEYHRIEADTETFRLTYVPGAK